MDKSNYEKKMERLRVRDTNIGDLNNVNKNKHDVEKFDREKDRGDLRRTNNNKESREEMELKEIMPDYGKSGRITNPKSNKTIQVSTFSKPKTSVAKNKQSQGDIIKQDSKTVNPKCNKHAETTYLNVLKPNMENTETKSLDAQKFPKIGKKFERRPIAEIKVSAQDIKNNDVMKRDVEKEKVSYRNKTYLDMEGRKHLKEKYTVKLKNSLNFSKKSDVVEECNKNCNPPDIANDKIVGEAFKVKSFEPSTLTYHTKAKEEDISIPGHRKPIIKTEIKGDNRVFKAVSFVDQKKNTPLQINISNEFKKQKEKKPPQMTEIKDKLKPSRESIKEPPARVRKRTKKRRIFSPDLLTRGNASPPTEVAKWVPSFLNTHTAPYYTAWVNTTLTATSKQKDKDLEQQMLQLQNIRENSPDLVHQNYFDERYTGKIKVRQRFDPRAVKMAEHCIR